MGGATEPEPVGASDGVGEIMMARVAVGAAALGDTSTTADADAVTIAATCIDGDPVAVMTPTACGGDCEADAEAETPAVAPS